MAQSRAYLPFPAALVRGSQGGPRTHSGSHSYMHTYLPYIIQTHTHRSVTQYTSHMHTCRINHMYTCKITCTHRHTCTHAKSHTHMQITCTHAESHVDMQNHMHMQNHTHPCIHSNIRPCTYRITHSDSYINTLTYAHALTCAYN